MTVKELKEQGYKVRISHVRYYDGDAIQVEKKELLAHPTWFYLKTSKELRDMKKYAKMDSKYFNSEAISPFGGFTIVEVTSPNGEEFLGISKCALKDNFNRKLGIKLALGRALGTF